MYAADSVYQIFEVVYGPELFKKYSSFIEIKEHVAFSLVSWVCVALLVHFACTEVSAFCFSLKIFTEKNNVHKKIIY